MNSSPLPRSLSLARLALALGLGLVAAVVSAAPTNVILRTPPGATVPDNLAALLSKWRQSGQVASVLHLTQAKGEKPGSKALFESFTVLEFPSEGAYEAWRREAATALPAGLIVRQADALTA